MILNQTQYVKNSPVTNIKYINSTHKYSKVDIKEMLEFFIDINIFHLLYKAYLFALTMSKVSRTKVERRGRDREQSNGISTVLPEMPLFT